MTRQKHLFNPPCQLGNREAQGAISFVATHTLLSGRMRRTLWASSAGPLENVMVTSSQAKWPDIKCQHYSILDGSNVNGGRTYSAPRLVGASVCEKQVMIKKCLTLKKCLSGWCLC